MNKAAIAATAGGVAGLILGAVYFAAPYYGVRITPAEVMVAAAAFAFGTSVALLTLAAFGKPEKKKEPSQKRLSDLGTEDYAHFPKAGESAALLVVRPDTVIEELDVVRNPSAYAKKNIFLTIKKSHGKTVFNPILLKRLFTALKDFEFFQHILLANEHDEYVGYIPAASARTKLVGDDAETLIRKYVVDVLVNPYAGGVLREIDGLWIDESVFDSELISAALKKMSDGLFRGLVVLKNKRNRKPIGVIYAEALVKLNMPEPA